MIPFERDLYVDLLLGYLKDMENKRKAAEK